MPQLSQALSTVPDSRFLFPLAVCTLLPEEPVFGEQRGWVVEEEGLEESNHWHLLPVVSISNLTA